MVQKEKHGVRYDGISPQIIGTPGHTAGHVSVYDPVGSLLVAGDALIGTDGRGVMGPSSQYSSDMVVAPTRVSRNWSP